MTAASQGDAHTRRGGAKEEAATATRAAISSAIATLTDGAFYQLVLFTVAMGGVRGSYALAALVGAAAGGVTNFTINRLWAFRSTDKGLLSQGAQYALGSLLTLVVLEAVLWVLVDRVGLDQRVAWLPAKIVAWGAFSYPFQRFFVFARVPQ